jgi:hypothetical protein
MNSNGGEDAHLPVTIKNRTETFVELIMRNFMHLSLFLHQYRMDDEVNAQYAQV